MHNQRRLDEHKGRDPEETFARFRAAVDSTIAPTGHTAAYLGEAVPDTKAALDGVTAVIFASSLGIGVMLSAVPVLIYQGAIALLGNAVAPLLSDAVITEMSAVG